MVVITGKHLAKIMESFPDAAKELAAWAKNVRSALWRNMLDIRAMYPDADQVAGYVVFNIRHNRYRLITVIHFSRQSGEKTTQGHLYIRSFLTHQQYDDRRNWDKEFGS